MSNSKSKPKDKSYQNLLSFPLNDAVHPSNNWGFEWPLTFKWYHLSCAYNNFFQPLFLSFVKWNMMWAKDCKLLEITLKILDNAALHKGFNWNIITENTYNRQKLLAITIPSLKQWQEVSFWKLCNFVAIILPLSTHW